MNRHGVELGEKKMYDEAIEEFNRAVSKYNVDSARAYHNKGWAQELAGELKGAVKSYEEAIYRNPAQLITGEKLGFLYYRLGDYVNAVRVGEFVLKYDPKNKPVAKWLPDAYMRKLKMEQDLLKAKKEAEMKKKEALKKKEEDKKIAQKKSKEEDIILYSTLDFMIRTGYYFAGEKGYKYVSDDGLLLDLPEKLFVRFTPRKKAEFSLTLENPYLGALTPDICIHNETFEGMYMLGDYTLGAGVMWNHYKSNESFGKTYSLHDFKVGLIFGFREKRLAMRFHFYPRFLPHDGESGSGKTYDTDKLEIHYTYTANPTMKYYSLISAKDYYVFDHSAELANYWGVYEIGLGVTLGNIAGSDKGINLSLSIEFRERFYLRDLENDDPYSMFNGQGWFGANSDKWLKGDPFSGFRAFGHELSFRLDEKINRYFFIYQKFIIEMGDLSEDHHEFNLLFGAGAML